MARPRSDAWLWILNAVVIGTVVLAAAAAATTTGHTVVAASNHFLLYYAGVLALIALTAEVGIGLVASDRIFMKPSARVTAQALHRAMGFGAIAFLVIHIVLEIIAGRSQPADVVVPFLDKGKTFYLGLGTVASDMFIVIMMTGIYRARLAANMSPKAWRVIHASAYAAWIFGLVHGLLAGRPAKAFFGFSGFVAWSYGACVVAVAAALMVRLVAKNRAGNELASHPVPDSGGGGGWTAAAATLTSAGAIPGAAALTATAMPAPALAAGAPGALDGVRTRSRPPGRTPLALPAGASAGQAPAGPRGRQTRSAPYDERAAYLADTRRIGATGPIGPGATGSFQRTSQFGGPGPDLRDRAGQHSQNGYARGEYGPGQPGSGQPSSGQPGSGQPRPGQPGSGQPRPGQPGPGQPRPGQPGQYGHTGPLQRVGPYEETGPMPRVSRPEHAGPASQAAPSGRTTYQYDTGQPPAGQGAYGTARPGPAQYAPPVTSRQQSQPGPYERPHDDWSGPMPQVGPPAAAPRYEAGRYDDWSGPLERIDPAAPPSRYGAPEPYGAPGPYGADGQYGRSRPEPRYERTGEIDRSGPYPQSQYGSPAAPTSYDAPVPQYAPGYRPAGYGHEGQSGWPMPAQPQSGSYERPHPAPYQSGPYESGQYEQARHQSAAGEQAHYEQAHYEQAQYEQEQYQQALYAQARYTQAQSQPFPGYQPAQPGPYQAPPRYEEPMQYDQFHQAPGGQSGQYSRPDLDPQQRAAHYASFAEQDASYTRPRPPGARDQFSPLDETDPLNIVPLNTGNYT